MSLRSSSRSLQGLFNTFLKSFYHLLNTSSTSSYNLFSNSSESIPSLSTSFSSLSLEHSFQCSVFSPEMGLNQSLSPISDLGIKCSHHVSCRQGRVISSQNNSIRYFLLYHPIYLPQTSSLNFLSQTACQESKTTE